MPLPHVAPLVRVEVAENSAAAHKQAVVGMADAKPGRKRKQTLPSIPRAARCGHCDSCKNPQWKKACLTVREQLMQQNSVDALPTKATPAAASNGSDDLASKLAAHLKPLLLANGGVAAVDVPRFVEVMRAQARRSARSMCIVIIERFDDAARLAMQRGEGLAVLHDWVKDAQSEAQDDLLLTLLQLFDTFAMDYDTLRRVPFGRTIGQLKKHANERVKAKSTALVAKWKALVPVKRGRCVLVLRGYHRVSSSAASQPSSQPFSQGGAHCRRARRQKARSRQAHTPCCGAPPTHRAK